MKKKPPPGATLIARLKEQRLAREAELARRQQGAGEQPAEVPAQPVAEQSQSTEKTKPAAEQPKVDSKPKSVEPAEAITHVEATVVEEPAAQTPGVPESTQPVVNDRNEVAVTRVQPEVPTAAQNGRNAANLLHRDIDIEDLRPTTDDYFVLTDEIRLAGRFAAVGLIAQGLRLARLKHDSIYKDHYPTFEEYCRKEHQMSATYAYRLIRMAEMAERVAELSGGSVHTSASEMPDPFEVMLSLGHRHLMALLPLEPEAAQELLLKGIPAGSDQRVPIGRATEKQIREALRAFTGEAAPTKAVTKKALANEKQLIPALSKLVEMLEDWSLWLGGEPPPELEAARMGRGQLLNRLAKRFRAASGKIADALEGSDEQ